MQTLRTRLILSHILPLIVILPLGGVLLAYLLETQVLLANLADELTQQATLTAKIAAEQSDIWQNSDQAQIFITRFNTKTRSEINLLDQEGNLIASNDSGDAALVGQPQEVANLTTVLAGQQNVQITYTYNLQADIVEVLVPVAGPNQEVLGVVRFSQALADVYDRFLSLRYIIAGVLGGTLVLALVVGWFLALNLERPIGQVTRAIDNIARGREWQTIPERGPHETRLLAQTFNTLIERLRMLEEARRRLLANLVHEVGRPIGALQAAIHALLAGNDRDPDLRRELLEGMQDEVRRLHPLLDNLTKLHDRVLGTLELNPQPTKLSDLLGRTIGPWREAAHAKGLHWQADIPLSLPIVDIDSERLAQVLGNLLSNAVKYTPAEGKVSVSAGVKDEAIWIQVSDTGPGLSEEEQARIFEPFYRSQSGRRFPQGMGLGLTIAQDLVVAHNGRLEVDSRPGEGSQFTVWLPLHID